MGRPPKAQVIAAGDEAGEKPALTRTLERGLILLTLVAKGGGRSLIDISREAGMSPSTALRLLETLRVHHFVEKDVETGLYRTAIGAFEVGSSYVRQNGLSESARIVLRKISVELGQTANLAILDRSDIVYIERLEADGPLGTRGRWGERLPAHSTAAGKAILAWSWESRCDEILGPAPYAQPTVNTIVDRDRLMRHLRTTRERGYARDDEESVLGLRCIAAPVLDREGRPQAAISISMLAMNKESAQEAVIAETVRVAAQRLAGMVGWQHQPLSSSRVDSHSVFMD
ncbi:IclR family transcriptional regulator [Ancylobacter sp. G4_0304]|uniref:IclR family transcriptional regulator n=1 Tax=Ancylobacter sp. G4_0304 TaxID=3114289 RepID=UPI0039C68F02